MRCTRLSGPFSLLLLTRRRNTQWPTASVVIFLLPHVLRLCLHTVSSRGEGRCEHNCVRVPLKLRGGWQANRDRRGNRYPLRLRPLLLVRNPGYTTAKSLFGLFNGLQTIFCAVQHAWALISKIAKALASLCSFPSFAFMLQPDVNLQTELCSAQSVQEQWAGERGEHTTIHEPIG